MFLNVANNIPLQIGDIMNWTIDDGSVEKWLLIQEEKKVNGTYRTFWIIRCNYLLKWINVEGHLQQSWSYVVSSVDSKIKGNYRTWNALITPQPNKYAEIIMPRYPIERATNFIIEEESWKVIEYDQTSVPGVIYLSLTENKINLMYDDLQNKIADIDKRAKYELLLPDTIQRFALNSIIEPVYTITKNGVPIPMEVEYISNDRKVARIIDNKLMAVGAGAADIELKLKNCDDIGQQPLTLHIEVTENPTEYSCYIKGPDTIKLDRKATYELVGSDGHVVPEVIFTVSDLTLATVVDNEVFANKKNVLGTVTLTATTSNNLVFTKDIRIIPLW